MAEEVGNAEIPPAAATPSGSSAPATEPMLAPVMEPRRFGPRAGDVIDSYELQQLIGEGSFGFVFVAEQRAPVRRRVAIKILKLGMDNEQLIARFEAERQALALMDHPHIAKVLDAGATLSGQPYFVMELVRGLPITDYCNRNKLPIRARLVLFKQVCEALQHAHQKGIIHRDLKPSNVIVGVNDGAPIPKVIDFGIAKALYGRLTDKTIYTDSRQLVGTPEYMSPEQADPKGLDIDTRSDIYSLGVLLYELLTATTPLDREQVRTANYMELQRLICETESPKPSTRVQAAKLDSALSEISHNNPRKLSQTLRRELDWITMRCLEKDRTRRYATANALSRDIERYLADEPVEARVQSATYRLRRLARKHRVAVRVICVAALMLAGATVFSVWQALRATRAEAKSRNEAAIAQAVNDFLKNDVLSQASPFNQVGIGRTPDPELRVRDALDNAALRVGTSFRSQPRVEVALRNVIGNAYRDIGQYEKSQSQLKAAQQITRGFPDDDPDQLLTLDSVARLQWAIGHYSEAETYFNQAVAGRAKTMGGDHPDTLASQFGLAQLYADEARYPDAELLLTRVLAVRREHLGERHRDTIESMRALGNLYVVLARYAEAEPLLEKAMELRSQALSPSHPDTLRCRENVASLYVAEGKYEKAEPLYVTALEAAKKTLGDDHFETLTYMGDLGLFYENEGRFAEAEPLLEKALAMRRLKMSDYHPYTLLAAAELAKLYISEGRLAEAEKLYTDALKVAPQVMQTTHPDVLRLQNGLGALYRLQARYGEAETLLRRALDGWKGAFGESHPSTLNAASNLANLYTDQGRFGEAQPIFERTLALCRATLGERHPQTLRVLNNLGVLFVSERDYEKAEPLYRQALDGSRKGLGESHPETLRYLDNLGVLYMEQKRPGEAADCFNRGLEISAQVLGKQHPETLRYMNNLGVLELREKHYKEAEAFCKDAFDGARQRFGDVNPETLRYLVSLVDVCQAEETPEVAVPFVKETISACAKALGESNATTVAWKRKLEDLQKSAAEP